MNVIVAGAGGFIGGHLCKRLEDRGDVVEAFDIKPVDKWYQRPMFPMQIDAAHDDLSWMSADWVINLAADMGGLGFIHAHKGSCALNCRISANILEAVADASIPNYLFASSACVYPEGPRDFAERSVYPYDPSEFGYGWEKLFSEKMTMYMAEEHGFRPAIARFHNVFGPYGAYQGGREKAPAAMLRKAFEYKFHGIPFEIWGNGNQMRSFLYVDDLVDGILALMGSDIEEPVNIGSEVAISITHLAFMACDIVGVDPEFKYVSGPVGVSRRVSNNAKMRKTGWMPRVSLREGMTRTARWIEESMCL